MAVLPLQTRKVRVSVNHVQVRPVTRASLLSYRDLSAKPNAAHYALARFSIDSIRQQIAPGSTFTLITQNVNGLSQRALGEVIAEIQQNQSNAAATVAESSSNTQPRLLEMHGRLMDVVCTSNECQHRELNTSSPICPALAGTENILEHNVDAEPDIPLEDLPRCTACGELARPGVVWFGEIP
jgi:NAD-dependent deacetylase sirtuin 5